MFAALAAMPLPDLAALVLAAACPIALAILCWPLFRPRPKPSAPAPEEPTRGLGLAGQWFTQSRTIAAGLKRHATALQLHRNAANHIGALDHEIDRLWRETRAVIGGGAAQA